MKKSLDSLKVACVYDWFDSSGGAERMLPVIAKIFPQADWYSSVVKENKTLGLKITPSFIQKIPLVRSHRLLSLPLYPFAFESFDFTGYDLVLSITSSFAKGVITRPETPHICYMLTPTRFLWSAEDDYISPTSRKIFKPLIEHLKKWDYIASQRPDKYIAISKEVSKRIMKTYNQTSSVIYPPFPVKHWEHQLRHTSPPSTPLADGYYIIVSRLQQYKKVDLAIKAFNKMPQRQLVIVGQGPEKHKLESMAKDNIHFIEAHSDAQLAFLYGHAKAFLMPQIEDFGYTSLEAQLCSCPVIAYNEGGATETVKHLKTGFLFNDQTSHGIISAIESFEEVAPTIDHHLQAHGSDVVEPFQESHFVDSFIKEIQSAL
jgi:glycosyltransferase involved in cell wall biosynthesis